MSRMTIICTLLGAVSAGVSAQQPREEPEPPKIRPIIALPRLLLPSDTGNSIGYHVGGGALPRLGEPRRDDEGTWGWDYRGLLLPRRVINSWWHGQRYQGGTGAYKTDGPKFR